MALRLVIFKLTEFPNVSIIVYGVCVCISLRLKRKPEQTEKREMIKKLFLCWEPDQEHI